jgi:hypothetical protein
MPSPDRSRLPGAWAVVAGLAVTVVALAAVGVLPRWPGLPHLVALPPLDLFADLRWLLTRSASLPGFLAGLVAVVAVRIVVLALLLGGLTRARVGFAARFYGSALVPALLAAQLNFSAHAALYSRLFWPAVTITGITCAVLAAAPWTGRASLRDAVRAAWAGGLRLWALAAYGAVLVVIGTAAEAVGAVALVPVSAAATLGAISWLRRRPPRAAALQIASTLAALVLLTAAMVVTRGTAPAAPVVERDGSLLVMSGINSASGEGAIFELDPAAIGHRCQDKYYFSYAGTGEGQPRGDAACPIRTGAPYQPEDTQRPFAEQVRLLAAQASELPEPVVVIGHSQAAWVAWQAAADGLLPGVSDIVLLGPFPASPLTWPPAGERGEGRVGGDGFRLLQPLANAADFDFEVDAPLARELLATADAAGAVFARPLPDDTRALAVTALPDLALMPDDWRVPGAENACPVREAHPYLPLTPAFHHEVNRFLDGGSPAPCPGWRPLVRPVMQAWGVPASGR